MSVTFFPHFCGIAEQSSTGGLVPGRPPIHITATQITSPFGNHGVFLSPVHHKRRSPSEVHEPFSESCVKKYVASEKRFLLCEWLAPGKKNNIVIKILKLGYPHFP